MEPDVRRGAQEWFKLMVDTGLAPAFRAFGFTGAGRTFRIPVHGYWAQVTLQQSTPTSESGVRFTLWLTVHGRSEWSDQLRVRPYSPGLTGRPLWEAPIGKLVEVGGYPLGELWWTLETGQPFEEMALEIIGVLRRFGLPALCDELESRLR
ncbi:uncharacterized protein DUF4304 [Herbihabitans rhizosphaerae]|uniref:Uncharacterized protein DUF4304 n=1 Tax=Herbihabitans rhizosphaerae TaxID=1872711 RepID=A0A4Q7KMC2_9PSEU|nr:DUF4304 domain-containing protein [Herbihabitans rhizosphaerae]RZS37829.1 uncharacterized protein DUF4304 [Herbihabitans rhizosphaerae]